MESTSPKQPFPFFKLPAELRIAIYKIHLHIDGTPIDFYGTPNPPRDGHGVPTVPHSEDPVNLFLTCRKIYDELRGLSPKRTLRLWMSAYQVLNTLLSPAQPPWNMHLNRPVESSNIAGNIASALRHAHFRSTITMLHLNIDRCELPQFGSIPGSYSDKVAVANCLLACYPALEHVQITIYWFRGAAQPVVSWYRSFRHCCGITLEGFPGQIEFSFSDQRSLPRTRTIPINYFEDPLSFTKRALRNRPTILEGTL